MKKQLSPAVVWGLLTVVVLVVVVVGYKMLAGGGFKADSKEDAATMTRVKEGGQMYTPPKEVPGIVIPGKEGGEAAPGGGAGAGGYNLTPPKF